MNQRIKEIRERLEAAKEASLTHRIKPELHSEYRIKCGYRVSPDPYWPGIEFYPAKDKTGTIVLGDEDDNSMPKELEFFGHAFEDISYLLGLFLEVETDCPLCKHPIHSGDYCDVCMCAAPIEI